MSPYLIAMFIAWVIAQGSKFLIGAVSNRNAASFRLLYASGNMPSSHSAIVVAMVTMIGFRDGVNSALFGLAVLFAAIVMYDAVMVRRSSGEQGEAIHALIKEQKSRVKQPRAARGHEPLEVVVGALIGFITSFVVYIAI